MTEGLSETRHLNSLGKRFPEDLSAWHDLCRWRRVSHRKMNPKESHDQGASEPTSIDRRFLQENRKRKTQKLEVGLLTQALMALNERLAQFPLTPTV